MELSDAIFMRSPLHPYTQSLLSAIPIPDPELNVHVNVSFFKAMYQVRSTRLVVVRSVRVVRKRWRCAQPCRWKEEKPSHFVACHLYW